jgi:hypothetical protein
VVHGLGYPQHGDIVAKGKRAVGNYVGTQGNVGFRGRFGPPGLKIVPARQQGQDRDVEASGTYDSTWQPSGDPMLKAQAESSRKDLS